MLHFSEKHKVIQNLKEFHLCSHFSFCSASQTKLSLGREHKEAKCSAVSVVRKINTRS